MHKFSARRLTPVLAAGICLLNLLPTGAYAPPEHPYRPVEGTVQTIRPSVCPIENGTPVSQTRPAVVQDTPPGESPAAPAPQAPIPGAPPGSPTAPSPVTPLAPAKPALPSSDETVPPDQTAEPEAGAAMQAEPPKTEQLQPAAPEETAAQPDHSALLALVEKGELTEADLEYLTLSNGRLDRLDRYSAWSASHPEASPEDVVLQVNLDQDRNFYQSPTPAAVPDSLSVLVNKHYTLSAQYIPKLEVLGSAYGSGSLRPEAAAAFRAMADAARTDGISLRSVSAYRSFQRQTTIYNRYLSQDQQSSVDTYSARPGSSEHQTGLALDINTASIGAHFEKTPAYAWLTEHCAQYGFILRYPKGKESLTGYRFEPWHYRYVGKEIAAACTEQGLTLEEYLALHPAEQPKSQTQTKPVESQAQTVVSNA